MDVDEGDETDADGGLTRDWPFDDHPNRDGRSALRDRRRLWTAASIAALDARDGPELLAGPGSRGGSPPEL